MNIWRLIAHHEESEAALALMKKRSRIAIGWSKTGDLRNLDISSPKELNNWIKQVRPDKTNHGSGGPSLWNLYHEMQIGDFIIVNSQNKRRCVFEVTGDYLFEKGFSTSVPKLPCNGSSTEACNVCRKTEEDRSKATELGELKSWQPTKFGPRSVFGLPHPIQFIAS